MEKTLHYRFQRRSKNYFDWLLNIIKSEKYYQAEGVIVLNNNTDRD
ncbi:hypothetical protein BN863_2150 [Formosa agariphila KMM 3901]|uniref:Uncharacterized protein n=1 Tax=Formosa agariphila (strain DSM 15362 / KCTC 12365 / LMG 23005 / KMM 3901 / M-2Alg 35-1) TaxID=1347342 RepID=T2KGK2_FORAG|nr:hypothetical protein [Formosa agariphila]CDF77927.1 hypothetical protein BN863_2150 [Formosa agariphila KMM 3901]